MSFETFIQRAQEQMQQLVEAGEQVVVTDVHKDNGKHYNGIGVRSSNDSAVPVASLEDMYTDYAAGSTLYAICAAVLQHLRDARGNASATLNMAFDLEFVKNNVFAMLINHDLNRDALAALVHKPYLDLEIILYIDFEQKHILKVTKPLLQQWGVSEESLFEYAFHNLIVKRPVVIEALKDTLVCMMTDLSLADSDTIATIMKYAAVSSLHIVTNDTGQYGAICMLYPDVLARFADKMNSDLIIFPSSVHEVLLFAITDKNSEKEASKLVREINSTILQEHVLANNAYKYLRETGKITII
ncbi:DUF5688 family protein [Lachnospiraceae bacterium 47-T17]